MRRTSFALALGLILGLSSVARAQFTETEPNDNKAGANAVSPLLSGGTITGNTTGSSTLSPGAASADNFRIQTAAAPLGIYRHRLVITTTGTAGHVGTIRGLTSTAGIPNAGTDATLQSSSTVTTPPRFNQWYGFGKGEEVIWRITGTASTTADYTGTLTTDSVTPINLGTKAAGNITIARAGHTNDTDFWVFDAAFNPLPGFGNDDPNTLTQTYAPGTYYLAYTNFNFATNLGSAGNPGETFLNGAVLDFPNAAVNSSTSTLANLGIRMTDACGTVDTPAAKTAPYEIVWGVFTVIPYLPGLDPWETNDAAASLALDGIEASATLGPASVVKCTGQYTRMTLGSTLLGMPWDLFLSSVPLVPAGPNCGATGIRTAGGQALNLDIVNNPASIVGLAGPFWFLNTWTGNQLIVINSATPFPTVCGQMVIADPTHADGFSLSGGACLRYDAPTTLVAPVAGPASDDSAVTVNVGCVPFFFQAFTQMHVISNGRITFGAADSGFSPSITTATAGAGWFGTWADLNPSGVGPANLITIDSPATGIFRAHYEQVAFFSPATDTLTTDLILDANNGSLMIIGLASLPAANTSTMMLGVCKGTGGTDPGATIYALGGPNAPAGPNAAIYAIDSVANLTTALLGINAIRFDVVTAGVNCGGYEWTALP